MKFLGHRGASHVAPENTILSSSLALASGMGFECDLQVVKGGQVIVLHDSTLYRTTAPGTLASKLSALISGARTMLKSDVGDLELDDVRAIDVGDCHHSEPVPLFTEFLHLIQNPPKLTAETPWERFVHMFAEIKSTGGLLHSSGFDSRLTEACATAVNEVGVTPMQLTWISFSLGALLDMKRRTPSHAALLVQWVLTRARAWEAAQLVVDSDLDGLDLNADPTIVTAELVDWLHARGKVVAVWVWKAPASNDVEPVWEHMARVGVDYFTSNLPPHVHQWQATALHQAGTH
jgi:glycerophosphoryl diester phosphodiesterase